MAFFHSPQVVTSGLMLALDARNPQSYPGSGTTFYDLSGRNNHFSIANGTSFNSGGWFNFDGTDDYMNNTSFTTTGLTNAASCVVWMRPNASQNDSTYNGLFSYGPRACNGATFTDKGIEVDIVPSNHLSHLSMQQHYGWHLHPPVTQHQLELQ